MKTKALNVRAIDPVIWKYAKDRARREGLTVSLLTRHWLEQYACGDLDFAAKIDLPPLNEEGPLAPEEKATLAIEHDLPAPASEPSRVQAPPRQIVPQYRKVKGTARRDTGRW